MVTVFSTTFTLTVLFGLALSVWIGWRSLITVQRILVTVQQIEHLLQSRLNDPDWSQQVVTPSQQSEKTEYARTGIDTSKPYGRSMIDRSEWHSTPIN